jgi:hypothetical protein
MNVHLGVDELIVCDEAPGTSFEDYTRFSSTLVQLL